MKVEGMKMMVLMRRKRKRGNWELKNKEKDI